VEAIGAILVRTPGGARIPLSQVADIAMLEGPSQISRESGQRRIGVECNITGRDLGGFVAEARGAIARDVALPPGYFLDWEGSSKANRGPCSGWRSSCRRPSVSSCSFFS